MLSPIINVTLGSKIEVHVVTVVEHSSFFFLGIFRFPFFPKQDHGFKTVSGTTMPKRGSFAPSRSSTARIKLINQRKSIIK